MFLLSRIHLRFGESCKLETGAQYGRGKHGEPMTRRISRIAGRIAGVATTGTLALGLIGAPPALAAAAHGDAGKGKTVFEQCSVCHSADTDEKKMGPSLKGLFKKPKLMNGKPTTESNVLDQINNGGNGMPPYGDVLSADDKANVLAYLRTL
jgi:mono/diheme cytochrome c family protein